MMEIVRKQWIRLRLHLGYRSSASNRLSRAGNYPRIFVGLAADYGNLGDLAITRAQLDFLRARFPKHQVIEVPISQTVTSLKSLRETIETNDIVTLIGGGNSGDRYDDIQCMREMFVSGFRTNRVVSFPQTVEYSTSVSGRYALFRTRRVYRQNSLLSLMARDPVSLVISKEAFPGATHVLAPDVVLTLDKTTPAVDRHGIILSMREDSERLLSSVDQDSLLRSLEGLPEARRRDTHLGDARLSRADADLALDTIWSDFRSAQLVITDRLHGMIFSVITGTPCIALDSKTGKVSTFYDAWLREVPGVVCVKGPDVAAVRRLAKKMVDEPPAQVWKNTFAELFATRFEELWNISASDDEA